MLELSPAAERNKEPIFSVLSSFLPAHAQVLEIASGTGQHGAFFSQKRPDLSWQCTEPSAEAVSGLEARRKAENIPHMPPPRRLDVLEQETGFDPAAFDALVNINMLHISPWAACLALMQKAESLLKADGILFLYGPFLEADVTTAASNLEFDRSLRQRNPAWGIRDRDQVLDVARRHGFSLRKRVEMPANNLSLILGRDARA